MFKGFISYFLGFLAGFLFFTAYINGNPYWLLVSIGITIATLAIALVVCHRVHKRMKKQHEDMIRTGGKMKW